MQEFDNLSVFHRMSNAVFFVALLLNSYLIFAMPTTVWSASDEPGQVSLEADFQAKIAQGVVVDGSEAPWMASLRNREATIFCGGVTISSRHILTAAHCVAQFYAKEIQIQVGSQTRLVERIWFPADFHHSSLDNDIAVITLAQPLVGITPVVMADILDQQLNYGQLLRVLGYGQTADVSQVNSALRFGEVGFVPAPECAAAWNVDFPSLVDLINGKSICAGGRGSLVDTCTGDSGGPLLVSTGGINPEFRLLGLTSFGEASCGGASKPSVYVKVAAFEDSIAKAQAGEAYTAHWSQVLVVDAEAVAPAEVRVIQIRNDSALAWNLGALDFAGESGFSTYSTSDAAPECLNQVLLPGASCRLLLEFRPETAGFFSTRAMLSRTGLEPLWIDLQGFGFEYFDESLFGSEGIFAFIGGEVGVNKIAVDGISNDGYLEWRGVPALNTIEIFVGVNQQQDLRVFFDFLPQVGEAAPKIELMRLNRFEDKNNLLLNRTLDWQSESFNLSPNNFLYIRVQARGLGLQGQLRFDLASDSEALQQDLQARAQTANFAAPKVNLETGGASDKGLLGLIFALLILGFAQRYQY